MEIERRHPVWSWRHNGLLVWPIIRIRLYLSLKNFLSKKDKQKRAVKKSDSVFFLLRGIREMFCFSLVKKGSQLVLSNAAFRSRVNEVYVDRVADPIVRALKEMGEDGLVIEFATDYKYFDPIVNAAGTYRLQPVFLLLTKLFEFRSSESVDLPGYQEFIDELSSKCPWIRGDFGTKNILLKLRRWSSAVNAWKVILRFAKPSRIFLNCYYDDKGLALLGAAKLLKIQTVDVQHGVQGFYHLAYSNWKMPKDKDCLVPLPDFFFVWNQLSTVFLDIGKSIVVGYPWVDAWKRGEYKCDTIIDQNIILYSLQPLENPFGEELKEVLRNAPSHYVLYIRVHPHEITLLSHYEQMAMQAGIALRIEVEKATRLPLPYILSHTRIHITKWSTVTLEASYFNVPTIFTHETGFALFEKEVSNKLLFLKTKVEDVLLASESDENPQDTAVTFNLKEAIGGLPS